MKLKSIGFISGILYKELQEDWKSALKRAADLGFSEIELGNHLGYSDIIFSSFCKSIGIRIIGGGIKLGNEKDIIQDRLEQLKNWGAHYAVVFWPWLKTGLTNPTLDDCNRSVECMNKMAEIASEIEIKLVWHNHDVEFQTMEEGLPFDYFMKHMDGKRVWCEMDTYWVAKSGADPVAILRRYPGRYLAIHVKDMANDDERSITCAGAGVLDFAPILAEAVNQDVEHFIVERERVEDGLKCLEVSARYLRSISL